MPIPYRKKFWLSYIVVPSWVQQLGVFAKQPLSSQEIQAFLVAIPRKFKHIHLSFTPENRFADRHVSRRSNYVLNLSKPYEELVKNYNKGRKSDVKKAKESSLELRSAENADALIELFISIKGSEVAVPDTEYEKLKRLTQLMKTRERIEIVEVYNEKSECLGGAIFLIDPSRITYLFSVATVEGRKKSSMSLVIDQMINTYSNSSCLLDFEGSNMDNLASFFKSFGAQEEPYYHYKKWRL